MTIEYKRARGIAETARSLTVLVLRTEAQKLHPKAEAVISGIAHTVEQRPLARATALTAVEKAVEEIRRKSI